MTVKARNYTTGNVFQIIPVSDKSVIDRQSLERFEIDCAFKIGIDFALARTNHGKTDNNELG